MTELRVRRRILVVDEQATAAGVVAGLAADGYDVRLAHDLRGTFPAVETFAPDLVVLRLPADADATHLALTRRLRDPHDLPVVCVVSTRSERQVLAAFDAGADDVATVVATVDELLARIRAVLRRSGRAAPGRWVVGDVVVDEPAHTVVRGDRPIVVTRREFDLLLSLVRQRGRVVPKGVLLSTVWGSDLYDVNVVEVHVSQLRRKLEAGGEPRLIHTVRHVGYVARAEAPRALPADVVPAASEPA
jgi:two-component system response regulator MprA